DVQILLHRAAGIGKKRPVRANAGSILACLCDAVRSDGHHAAVANFHFAVQLQQAFGLPAVFGTKGSAAEDPHHGVRTLQVGEFSSFAGVIGEFVIRKFRSGDNIGPHGSPQCEVPTNARMYAAISSAAVSSAKWPPSRM